MPLFISRGQSGHLSTVNATSRAVSAPVIRSDLPVVPEYCSRSASCRCVAHKLLTWHRLSSHGAAAAGLRIMERCPDPGKNDDPQNLLSSLIPIVADGRGPGSCMARHVDITDV